MLVFCLVALAALSACSGTSATSEESTEAETDEDAPAAADDTTHEDADEAPTATYDFSEVSPVAEAFIEEKGLNGAGLIVVDRDDGVIHHDHWGEFDEDRVSLVASSSKMITAGVLLKLADEGLLDMDAPIADVVDWGAANPDITPAQLVSNSSGLVGLLGATPPSYACQYVYTGTLQECAEMIFTTAEDDADVIAPDTDFRYGGAQWQVAGAVAEAASGKSWAQLIDEIYVQPCGLETLGYNNHFTQFEGNPFSYPEGFTGDTSTLESTENPNLEGGAYVTTGDYGKLLAMHLRGGMCDEVQVLSQVALDQMHADRVQEVYGGDAYVGDAPVGDPGQGSQGYGMGWWVERDSGYLNDGGMYGSVPWLDLEDGYGVFLVIEADSVTGQDFANRLKPIIDAAVAGA